MPVERISIKAFNTAISEFRASVTNYEQAREKLFSVTDKLLIDWEGDGRDKYEKAYLILKTQLKDEEDSLRAIADNLENIGLSYQEMDESIASKLKE